MRTFIAIELTDGIKLQLSRLQGKLQRFDRAVRWMHTEHMHLTLRFLGDVDDNRIPAVCKALDEAGTQCRPFDITVKGAGCFPPSGGPRVVWAGVENPDGGLQACYQAVETALDGVGFDREGRPFSPHLTVGRIRSPGSARGLRESVAALSDVAGGELQVAELVFFSSELRRHGPLHTPMHHIDLGH